MCTADVVVMQRVGINVLTGRLFVGRPILKARVLKSVFDLAKVRHYNTTVGHRDDPVSSHTIRVFRAICSDTSTFFAACDTAFGAS